ncbi:MAG: PGF-pre-PGF domain-containing protein [Chloroflexi bacterium]|nr:PGF-pre-PGF domain-containing protein [Chloroflexota bacterium]
MEQLTSQKLNTTISQMSEKSLTERLPGLSAEKLYSLDSSVLFKALPNTPTEQLVGETPPSPPAELGPPVVVLTTTSGAKYLAIKTLAGEWAIVVGTPLPLDKLLIKTKRELSNVGTTIEVLAERPTEVTVGLPADQTVLTYVGIAFENAAPNDIELGHLTFKVEQEWLRLNSLHKWSVMLNRWDKESASWVSVPTKRVKEDDAYAYYSATITHFSTFAITGSQAPPVNSLRIANLVISPTKTEIGSPVKVSAEVTNLSKSARIIPVTLWINGTAETGKDVSLQANETKLVSFTVTKSVEGNFKVRLDRAFGEFQVSKLAGINWWLIGIIVLVIVAGLVAWMIVSRRKTA